MAKKAISLLYCILIFSIFSCTKDEHTGEPVPFEANYCINTTVNLPFPSLPTSQQLTTSDSLFDVLQMSKKNVMFYNLVTSSGCWSKSYHVKGYYCANNGLRVFNAKFVYSFIQVNDGSPLYLQTVHAFSPVDLDSTASMKKKDVVRIFVDAFEKDSAYVKVHGLENKQAVLDNCFDVEFGYYDISKDTGGQGPVYVKAWHIRPQLKRIPTACINDSSGAFIYYKNQYIIN